MSYSIGDVISYHPSQRHCREGIAVMGESGLVDTYWHPTGGGDRIKKEELSEAETLFNIGDYDEVKHGWEEFNPNDRRVITSQHGLRKRLFVRKGATKCIQTQVSNAEEKLRLAKQELDSALYGVKIRERELAEIRSKLP